MSILRGMVLSSFKKLHRTRLKVFEGDVEILTAARQQINEEYKKNINVKDEESIRKLIKQGQEVEREIRTQIIQSREVRPGVYAVKINKDTEMLDNVPFDINAIPKKSVKRKGKCCQDISQTEKN